MKRFDMNGNEVQLIELCRNEPEWAANRIKGLEAEVSALIAHVEKLLRDNESNAQCIANIIDTKPGGSIEGQMIAATKQCVEAEQRVEKLEAELAALKKDARIVTQAAVKAAHHEVLNAEEWEAACRILEATREEP